MPPKPSRNSAAASKESEESRALSVLATLSVAPSLGPPAKRSRAAKAAVVPAPAAAATAAAASMAAAVPVAPDLAEFLCEEVILGVAEDGSLKFGANGKPKPGPKRSPSNPDVVSRLPPPPPPRAVGPTGGAAGPDILPVWEMSEAKTPCGCSRSGCLKMYCTCYAAKTHCSSACKCGSCLNNMAHRVDWARAFRISESRKPSQLNLSVKISLRCACSSTNCMKRYCECYRAGAKCNSLCRCVACLNR